MRRNRKLLAVLLVFLLVGATVTFQLGLKLQRENQVTTGLELEHDKELANQNFTAATTVEVMYEYLTKWYVQDYRYANKGTEKTDIQIITGYKPDSALDSYVSTSGKVFTGDADRADVISADDKFNTLTPVMETSIQGEYPDYNTFQTVVADVTDETKFDTVFNIVKNHSTRVTNKCNLPTELEDKKTCILESFPEQVWNGGVFTNNKVKMAQQKITTDLDIEIYYNVDMANALARIKKIENTRLTNFVDWFRNKFSEQLTSWTRDVEYTFTSDAGFLSNEVNKDLLIFNDMKLDRRA